jgi:hypothetical protein
MTEELDFFDKLDGITLDKDGNKVPLVDNGNEETEEEKQARLNKEAEDKAKEEDKLKDNKNDEEDEDDSNTSGNLYQSLATVIKEDTGLFTNFEKPIEKAEDLIEGIKFEVIEGINDYKKSLPEDFQQMLEKHELGLDWTTIKELKSNEIKLNAIKESDIESDEQIAKDIFIAGLKATTKWTEARIQKEYEKALDLEEVVERSKEFLEDLKRINVEDEKNLIENLKKQEQAEKENYQKVLKELKDSIYDNNGIIPGLKLTDKEKADLYAQMTKPISFDKQGNPISKVEEVRAKNPIQFEKTLNYLLMKGVFDEKPNFEFITKSTKTQTIKNLEKLAEEEMQRKASGKAPKETNNLSESILAAV